MVTENRHVKNNRIRALYQRYRGTMEDWQIKLAIARMIYYRVPRHAWEDTMQDMAIVIRAFRFDLDKAHAASEETILCRLLDNHIRMRARGNARYRALLARIDRMAHQIEDSRTPDDNAADGEVRQLVSEFSPLRQQICQGLIDGLSIPEIATATDRHYTTIYRHVTAIRKTFADRGFDSWPA